MKAAELEARPNFPLMKQSDIISFYHMQMPRWLFSSAVGKKLSLEAKVAYTFLLNRFQLSRLNHWVNSQDEVFVIFTRESLAEEVGISYRKAIDCFRELTEAGLIWEKRVGRGNANQIYLASVALTESDAAGCQSAPFANGEQPPEQTPPRPAENAGQEPSEEPLQVDRGANQDLPFSHIQTCENGTSRSADSAVPDLQKPHTSYTDKSDIDLIHMDKSPSAEDADKRTLQELIGQCGLEYLPGDAAIVFRNVIERLWYAKEFTVDGICLPREKLRADLKDIHADILLGAYGKLQKNKTPVKSSTAYISAVLLNYIREYYSDAMVDPFLNQVIAGIPCPGVGGDDSC